MALEKGAPEEVTQNYSRVIRYGDVTYRFLLYKEKNHFVCH